MWPFRKRVEAVVVPQELLAPPKPTKACQLRAGQHAYILADNLDIDSQGRLWVWELVHVIDFSVSSSFARIDRVEDGFVMTYAGPPFNPGKKKRILGRYYPVVALRKGA